MPANNHLETVTIGPFTVPRLFNGLWQLSGNGWGSASASHVRKSMKTLADSGYVAFVREFNYQADHYGSAEILFGMFREKYDEPQRIVGATKWCVFKDMDPTAEAVRAAVNERLERMQVNTVDILQFHWNDYENTKYIDALERLRELQQEGLITCLGLCNFDSVHTDEICTRLSAGAIVTNQVQFSLIDTRPLDGMADVCQRHNVKLLTYGTLCGGFLADKWLGESQPDVYSTGLTPSQRKYLDMIMKAWGDWPLFQELLAVLRRIGDRHDGRSISNIALRWVLDHDNFVGAVLIGTRMGISEHAEDNNRVSGFRLTQEDKDDIDGVLTRSNGRQLVRCIGDCGAEYR